MSGYFTFLWYDKNVNLIVAKSEEDLLTLEYCGSTKWMLKKFDDILMASGKPKYFDCKCVNIASELNDLSQYVCSINECIKKINDCAILIYSVEQGMFNNFRDLYIDKTDERIRIQIFAEHMVKILLENKNQGAEYILFEYG